MVICKFKTVFFFLPVDAYQRIFNKALKKAILIYKSVVCKNQTDLLYKRFFFFTRVLLDRKKNVKKNVLKLKAF